METHTHTHTCRRRIAQSRKMGTRKSWNNAHTSILAATQKKILGGTGLGLKTEFPHRLHSGGALALVPQRRAADCGRQPRRGAAGCVSQWGEQVAVGREGYPSGAEARRGPRRLRVELVHEHLVASKAPPLT